MAQPVCFVETVLSLHIQQLKRNRCGEFSCRSYIGTAKAQAEMAAFLGIARPPSHTLFSSTFFTRQFSFTNNSSISMSRKRFSQFKPRVTASLHSSKYIPNFD